MRVDLPPVGQVAAVVFAAGVIVALIAAFAASAALTSRVAGLARRRGLLTRLALFLLGAALLTAGLPGWVMWSSAAGPRALGSGLAAVLLLAGVAHTGPGEGSADRVVGVILAWLAVGDGAWAIVLLWRGM